MSNERDDSEPFDWQRILRHITPLKVFLWTLVIAFACGAVITVLYYAALAWQSS